MEGDEKVWKKKREGKKVGRREVDGRAERRKEMDGKAGFVAEDENAEGREVGCKA